MDVAAARLRLVEAAQLVQVEAWTLWQTVPAIDLNAKLGLLGKILAAQQQESAMLGHIENATLAAELAELRQQVAELRDHRGTPRRTEAA